MHKANTLYGIFCCAQSISGKSELRVKLVYGF